ncbi:hypothetical protein AB4068_11270 [Arthrobacter sp. 2RAF22]|uniref:hypothetical protein n=1 Tax=Arthrobacter sp. 2RAF22 TaxID=3232996 RepID=UPI003F90C40F
MSISPTAAQAAPDLEPVLDELAGLGTALIRTFNSGPFPVRSRLARNIRTVLTQQAPAGALHYRIGKANTMLQQMDALQTAIADLPDISVLYIHRLAKIADILTVYRASLEPDASPRSAPVSARPLPQPLTGSQTR